MERAAFISESLFSGTERTEVLRGFGDDISPQRHFNAANVFAVCGHIKVAHGIGGHSGIGLSNEL